jgi:hypothetical protein
MRPGFNAEACDEEIGVIQTVGEAYEIWFAAQLLSQGDTLSLCAADFFCAAR